MSRRRLAVAGTATKLSNHSFQAMDHGASEERRHSGEGGARAACNFSDGGSAIRRATHLHPEFEYLRQPGFPGILTARAGTRTDRNGNLAAIFAC
jgi:hypothetical protein